MIFFFAYLIGIGRYDNVVWIFKGAIIWREFRNDFIRLHVNNEAHHHVWSIHSQMWPVHHIQLATVDRSIGNTEQPIANNSTVILRMERSIGRIKALNTSIFTIGNTQQTQIAGQCHCMWNGEKISRSMIK